MSVAEACSVRCTGERIHPWSSKQERVSAGNRSASSGDYYSVDCIAAREVISALLDGENAWGEQPLLERHLAGCAACREWRDRAHEVTRRARLVAVGEVPSPGRKLFALAFAASRARGFRVSTSLLRAGLVAVAVVQAAFAIPDLVFGSDRGAPVHVAHEIGSFDMALAVGLLVAAWQPARAHGMRIVVGGAALLLVGTALVDLLTGHTNLVDEAPHLLAVAGWLLLRRLAEPGAPRGEALLAPVRRLARAVGLTDLRPLLRRRPEPNVDLGATASTAVASGHELPSVRAAGGGGGR